jgi:hypothetical protein
MSNVVIVESTNKSLRGENEKTLPVAVRSGSVISLRGLHSNMEHGPVVWVCQRRDIKNAGEIGMLLIVQVVPLLVRIAASE